VAVTPRPPRPERPAPPPLDAAALRNLGLRYVGRYATTAAKLQRYLARKLWERGWGGDGAAPVEALVAGFVEQGYVDDRSFGEARARGLASKGFGQRRVGQDLQAAGLARDLVSEIGATVDGRAAAERFAQRRRFGPWDRGGFDPDRHRKQVAAMLRAGHDYATTRAVLRGNPVEE
jgi:regulatory protein